MEFKDPFFSLVGNKKYKWFTSDNTHDKGAVENEWKYIVPFWNEYRNYRDYGQENHYIDPELLTARARGVDEIIIDVRGNDADGVYQAKVIFMKV